MSPLMYLLSLLVFVGFLLFILQNATMEVWTFFIGGTLVLGLAFYLFKTKSINVDCHEVVSIGGCDRYTCGVMLDNGERREVGKPVIGQIVCHNKIIWD